ncbi:cytochrome-c oxidase [Pelagivirga sediminicola]|uniref:Cytochrome-c oxidase n=1 Tax=Pelagivirga sediminicola TaxID=2170575 RepID=A0A2T7G9C1_9RHOB|nr:cytochrome c oxidase assembly protein [Pelagivirga sediminicola]PVA11011.1 cytochrome-c oxidase [Pelagivirga sediminicola]
MRGAALISALALAAFIWVMPLEAWFGAAFPAHMLRHMMLVAVIPPLLVLGAPRLADRIAPAPMIAAAIEFVLVWAWHLPAVHGFAFLSRMGFAFEQGSFLLAGILVWAGCLRAGQPLMGAGGLLLTSMHMTLLGALIVLAPRDLYAEICGLAPDLSAQQSGGLLMLGIGTPVYLVAGLILTARALGRTEAHP